MDIDATQVVDLGYEDNEADIKMDKRKVGTIKTRKHKSYSEHEFPVFEGINIIGRDERSDVHIKVQGLSKKHACIEVEGESCLIFDLESRNKTRKGKMLLKPYIRYELNDGDELTFGDVITIFNVTAVDDTDETDSITDAASETGSESMIPLEDNGNANDKRNTELTNKDDNDLYAAETESESDGNESNTPAETKSMTVISQTPGFSLSHRPNRSSLLNIPDSPSDQVKPELQMSPKDFIPSSFDVCDGNAEEGSELLDQYASTVPYETTQDRSLGETSHEQSNILNAEDDEGLKDFHSAQWADTVPYDSKQQLDDDKEDDIVGTYQFNDFDYEVEDDKTDEDDAHSGVEPVADINPQSQEISSKKYVTSTQLLESFASFGTPDNISADCSQSCYSGGRKIIVSDSEEDFLVTPCTTNQKNIFKVPDAPGSAKETTKETTDQFYEAVDASTRMSTSDGDNIPIENLDDQDILNADSPSKQPSKSAEHFDDLEDMATQAYAAPEMRNEDEDDTDCSPVVSDCEENCLATAGASPQKFKALDTPASIITLPGGSHLKDKNVKTTDQFYDAVDVSTHMSASDDDNITRKNTNNKNCVNFDSPYTNDDMATQAYAVAEMRNENEDGTDEEKHTNDVAHSLVKHTQVNENDNLATQAYYCYVEDDEATQAYTVQHSFNKSDCCELEEADGIIHNDSYGNQSSKILEDTTSCSENISLINDPSGVKDNQNFISGTSIKNDEEKDCVMVQNRRVSQRKRTKEPDKGFMTESPKNEKVKPDKKVRKGKKGQSSKNAFEKSSDKKTDGTHNCKVSNNDKPMDNTKNNTENIDSADWKIQKFEEEKQITDERVKLTKSRRSRRTLKNDMIVEMEVEHDIVVAPRSNRKRGATTSSLNGKKLKCSVDSPRRLSVTLKPRIAFTGMSDKAAEKVVTELGGEIVDNISKATHLVTDKVRRTVKFLCAVGKGIPIVNSDWIKSSKISNIFTACKNHMLIDECSEKQYKFQLKRSILKAAETPLLANFRIFVTKNVQPDPKNMKEMIECCGGKFLSKIPQSPSDDLIVISCLEDEFKNFVQQGFCVCSNELLLTGILRQVLDINQFLLSNGIEPELTQSKRRRETNTTKRKR